MHALRNRLQDRVVFAGVGGVSMTQAGLQSIFPMQELSTIGFLQPLLRIFPLMARLGQTVRAAHAFAPDILVTIDSPGFALHFAPKVQGLDCLRVHYVAPTVWARAAHRAPQIARLYHLLLTIFPFEAPFFTPYGLPVRFLGHPMLEMTDCLPSPEEARKSLRVQAPVLCLLPGSRQTEWSVHIPVFRRCLNLVRKEIPGLSCLLPCPPHLVAQNRKRVQSLGKCVRVLTEPTEKYAAFRAADVALCASGSVTIELAAAGLPAVVVYRMWGLSRFLSKKRLHVPWVSAVNIVAQRKVQPEYIQSEFQPKSVASALCTLFSQPRQRRRQQQDYREVVRKLQPPSFLRLRGGVRAADAILQAYMSRNDSSACAK